MASPAKDWRKAREEGIELEFPSGLKADIRPVEVDFFVRTHEIPDVLAPLINEILSGKPYTIQIPEEELKTRKTEWIPFLNQLVAHAFVKPQVADRDLEEAPLADDEISVDDVSYVDKYFLFLKFAQPANRLRGFRPQQAGNVAVVEPAANNGREAIPDPAH